MFPGKQILITLLLALLLLPAADRALAGRCDRAWNWYQEGLGLSDDSTREIFCYQRAIELCPDLIEAYIRLGEVFRNQGLEEEALEVLRRGRIRSLTSDTFMTRPGSGKVFIKPLVISGEIYRRQGLYDQAAAEFSQALGIDPGSGFAQNQLQYIYKRQDRYASILPPRIQLMTTAIFARIPGMTLPKGGLLMDAQYRTWIQTAPTFAYDLADTVPFLPMDVPELDLPQEILFNFTPLQRKSQVNLWVAGIRYGLTNDLTIGLMPKFFFRESEVRLEAWDEVATPEVAGFGDTVFMLKYRLYGQRRNHLSIYHLLSIPTGDENASGQDKGIFRWIPLGSGSFDFTPGISFSSGRDPYTVQGNLQYRITDGVEVGDELDANLALIWPLGKAVNSLLEVNYRWRGEARKKQRIILMKARPEFIGPSFDPVAAGAVEVDTWFTEKGGSTLFVSPGMQFTLSEGLKLEIGVQIPVLKEDDGWQEGVILHLGLTRILF
ncbi:transporter [Thermodesulfobacteriota bacterium B35]